MNSFAKFAAANWQLGIIIASLIAAVVITRRNVTTGAVTERSSASTAPQ